MTKGSQRRAIFSFGIFLILLCLSSCASSKKEQIQKETGEAGRRAQVELEAGEFQKAIDLYRDTARKYPNDPIVRSGYIKTLESIKKSGDRALERTNYALAESIYEILGMNWSQFTELIQSLSFDKNFLEKKARTSRNLLALKQVRLSLETGDFRKAIEVQREFFQRYPQDSTVRSAYLKTLESIKMKGDQAFEKNDFALAGHIYETLVRNISPTTPLNRSLSFDRGGMTKRIEGCRKTLFENGLEQYRSGNLNRAISLWKDILVFDPENQEVRKAVDMAVLQSKNLEKAK